VFAAQPTDSRHVIAIGAHTLSALPARGSRFIRRKLMGGAFLMGGTTTLAGNLALAISVHGRKTTISCSGLHSLLRLFFPTSH